MVQPLHNIRVIFHTQCDAIANWYDHQITVLQEPLPLDGKIQELARRILMGMFLLVATLPLALCVFLPLRFMGPHPHLSALPLSLEDKEAPSPLRPALTKKIPSLKLAQQTPTEETPLIDIEKELTIELDHLFHEVTPDKLTSLQKKFDRVPIGMQATPLIRQIKQILSFLKLEGVGSNEFKWAPSGRIFIAADGNCLFGAVEAQLTLLNRANVPDRKQLRKASTKWIKDHKTDDVALKDLFLPLSIEDYKDAEKRRIQRERVSLESLQPSTLSREEAINRFNQLKALEDQEFKINTLSTESYCKLCGQDKFFGGVASLYALSQLYHVRIELRRQHHDRAPIEQVNQDPVFGEEFEEKIYLILVNGDHFEPPLPGVIQEAP